MKNDSPETLAIALRDENPSALMRRATDVAGVCKAIALKTAVNIHGRKYVRCEGWMSIATAHGCIASSRDVEKIEGGWRAIGEIRRIADGVVLSTAEGFVGTDETATWGKRPEYACRAMAQTRAISRACRAAFAHVIVLMDAGLDTTPAEEVPPGGFTDVQSEPAKAEPPAPPAASDEAPPPPSDNEGCEEVIGRIEQIAVKEGVSKKGPWKRYGIRIGETWLNTFSDTLHNLALAIKERGEETHAWYEVTERGNNLKALDKI